MIGGGRLKSNSLLALPVLLLFLGCGIASSYRTADLKTIRDFPAGIDYRKRVGVMALVNTTFFTSEQVAAPFMTAFLSGVASTASDAALVVPGTADVPSFLWDPPRIANGEIDVFSLSGLARQAGMNAVVSPLLMDIRVRSRDTGFWFFKDIAYTLQIQTAAAIYDVITGARLDIGILTDEIDIDEQDAAIIRNGQEIQVLDLIDVAEEMGQELGRRMGDAIHEAKWLASVVAIEDDRCVMMAGSDAGIAAGDRFAVMDGSAVLTGLDGQRYIVPGTQTASITISRVAPRISLGAPESGALPPIGSILVPDPR